MDEATIVIVRQTMMRQLWAVMKHEWWCTVFRCQKYKLFGFMCVDLYILVYLYVPSPIGQDSCTQKCPCWLGHGPFFFCFVYSCLLLFGRLFFYVTEAYLILQHLTCAVWFSIVSRNQASVMLCSCAHPLLKWRSSSRPFSGVCSESNSLIRLSEPDLQS